MTDLEIVTDDRYPGWRARIVTDTNAGQPWGDAHAPALLAERGHVEWASEVYQSKHAARILEAWRRLDTEVFQRHLRLAHGTANKEITDQDARTGPADLTGEIQQWRAWLDGDVYDDVVVERHTADRCWTHQDSPRGLYG